MTEHVLNLDRPRKLKFGFRACRLIREKFGDKEINDLLSMKVDEMPVIAWAGMVWDDVNMTAEKAEEIIEQAIFEEKTRIIDVINTISACLIEQFGAQKKTMTGSESTEPAASPDGSESSATPSKT
jgi:hypothetical protein